MHHTNFFTTDQTVLPACNHEVIYDSPPKNYKLNSIVKINKKLFRYEEYFLKVNKKVLRAEKYSHGLKFYDVCGSQSYFVGFTKWDKNNLCYDLFLGTRKELTIHVEKKENVSLRVCFLHCLHQNNTFCNKWPFMYEYNELTENVYKDLKNFSLTRLNSPEKITLSFAKRNENEYIMVHSFPWTGLTAFAVCASLLLY